MEQNSASRFEKASQQFLSRIFWIFLILRGETWQTLQRCKRGGTKFLRQASLYATEVQNESSEFCSILRTSFRFLDEVDVRSKNLQILSN